MKSLFRMLLPVATVLLIGLSACKKDSSSTPTPTPTVTDSLTDTKTCYQGSGSLKVTGFGFSSINCDIACVGYTDNSSTSPGYYQAFMAMAEQTLFGSTINFYFKGKSFPKSGTYKVMSLGAGTGPSGSLADDEVFVAMTSFYSSTTPKNTLVVTNDKGTITFKSDRIELFDIAGNPKSVVSELNVTRSTTKK